MSVKHGLWVGVGDGVFFKIFLFLPFFFLFNPNSDFSQQQQQHLFIPQKKKKDNILHNIFRYKEKEWHEAHVFVSSQTVTSHFSQDSQI